MSSPAALRHVIYGCLPVLQANAYWFALLGALVQTDASPTVAIADFSRMDCQLLADTLQRHNQFRVVGSTTKCDEIIALIREFQPDIVLMSSRLHDGPLAGLRALQDLRAMKTRSRVIILLDESEPRLVVESFRSGARGIFCRSGVAADIRKCIQIVLNGEICVNKEQLEYVFQALMQTPSPRMSEAQTTQPLSNREEQIAHLVATGLSNREVAKQLGLSQHTVKNYLFRLFEKLSISTRTELVLYVLSRGKDLKTEVSDTSSKEPREQIRSSG
jgi:DNA-binding NarL/FixJ family response regulator